MIQSVILKGNIINIYQHFPGRGGGGHQTKRRLKCEPNKLNLFQKVKELKELVVDVE